MYFGRELIKMALYFCLGGFVFLHLTTSSFQASVHCQEREEWIPGLKKLMAPKDAADTQEEGVGCIWESRSGKGLPGQ